jgi:GH15 family glucan-1,4-alpha-glucosidase
VTPDRATSGTLRVPVEINDLALLSNCQSAGLVDGHGGIRWLCWPRFDSSPLFSDLLDPTGGLWRLKPIGPSESSRRYLSDSLVLRTTFQTPTGRAELTDALVLGQGERGHDIGKSSPPMLIRRFAVTEGQVTLTGCLMPRGQFGQVQPLLEEGGDRLRIRLEGQDLALHGPAPDAVVDGCASWHRRVAAGERVTFSLGIVASPGDAGSERVLAAPLLDRIEDTLAGWRSWSALHNTHQGGWRDEVLFSARLLQGLTFAPTGAVIAAPTTSLPRRADGQLNRDYRLVLMEDAPATAAALRTAACATEAERSVTWLLEAATVPTDPPQEHLRAVLAVDGSLAAVVPLASAVAGWRDSQPVRLLEQGWRGSTPEAVSDLLAAVHEVGGRVAPVSAQQVERLLRAVTSAREEAATDTQGGARTAVARWVALDVASTSLAWLPQGARSMATDAAARTAREVREEGWDEATRTFTAFAPAVGVEASSLLLSLSGLIAPDDPAMARTVERVADALSAPCGLLYRYETARGLEGPSIVCTYWLVRCLAAEGQLERAEALFEQTTAYANDVGLLSEQSDPSTGQLLGNFPYAASHAGLILAARDLYKSRSTLSRAARTNRRR